MSASAMRPMSKFGTFQMCLWVFMFNLQPANTEFHVIIEKLHLNDAMFACRLLGWEWYLPGGMFSKSLSNAMEEHGLSSAWLPIFRRSYVTWRWVNGMKGITLESENDGKYCAVLTMTGQITPATCSAKHTGLVCEISAGLPCPKDHSCIYMNKAQFSIACTFTNWYGARSLCLSLGGDLAVLNTNSKALKVALRLSQDGGCRNVFIGLHKEDWVQLNSNDEENVLLHTKWGPGQPSPLGNCAVVVKSQQGVLSWNAVSCLDVNKVICYKGEELAVSTTSPNPSGTMSQVIPSDHFTSQKLDKVSPLLLACIMVIAPGIVVTVACILRHFINKASRHRSSGNSADEHPRAIEEEDRQEMVPLRTPKDEHPMSIEEEDRHETIPLHTPKANINILIVGPESSGKSSLINSLTFALGTSDYPKLKEKKSDGEGKANLCVSQTLKREPEIPSLKGETLNFLGETTVTFLDMLGLSTENERKRENTNIFKLLLSGDLKPETSIEDIYRGDFLSRLNRFHRIQKLLCGECKRREALIHYIIFVANVTKEFPEFLVDALREAQKQLHCEKETFVVFTHLDCLEEKSNKNDTLKNATAQAKNLFGINTDEIFFIKQYCDRLKYEKNEEIHSDLKKIWSKILD